VERLGLFRVAPAVRVEHFEWFRVVRLLSDDSTCRSATVILIIDSILYARISDPGPGMPEYTFAPAPSPRALWDAENERDWAVGYAGHLHANATHGMLKNRDLVALREAAGKDDDRWYAYADSFGILVTLVANLII
jgi:hypothetical protein